MPYDDGIYYTVISTIGDQEGRVTELAEFFGIDLTECKRYVFDSFCKDLPPVVFEEENENEIIEQVERINRYKEKIGLHNYENDIEPYLKNGLAELDLKIRTINGFVFETREEAKKVDRDFDTLLAAIKAINFDNYDLLNETEVHLLKQKLFDIEYQSDSFKSDNKYVESEFNVYYAKERQKQEWKNSIIKSDTPYVKIGEIIQYGGVQQKILNKIEFWYFDGIKKNKPVLLMNEQIVLYIKRGLLGWNNYLAFTNKRILDVNGNNISNIDINTNVKCLYDGSTIFITNGIISFPTTIKCSYHEANKTINILNVIIGALIQCDDKKFRNTQYTVPVRNKMAPSVNIGLQQTNSKELMTENNDNRVLTQSEFVFCTQCGNKMEARFNFCYKCGARLKK